MLTIWPPESLPLLIIKHPDIRFSLARFPVTNKQGYYMWTIYRYIYIYIAMTICVHRKTGIRPYLVFPVGFDFRIFTFAVTSRGFKELLHISTCTPAHAWPKFSTNSGQWKCVFTVHCSTTLQWYALYSRFFRSIDCLHVYACTCRQEIEMCFCVCVCINKSGWILKALK